MEQWAAISGWEDLYEASTAGRIRSLDRVVEQGFRQYVSKGRVLAAAVNPGTGRRHVTLYRYAERTNRAVHQLILETFVGPRPPGMLGCHNDGNPLNNEVGNLRWDTPSSNMLDMGRHGTDPHANQTHCVNGHEFTPENTVVQVREKTGRIRRACRTCLRDRRRAHAKRIRHLRSDVERLPTDRAVVNAAKTECRRGHPFTPENTYIRKTGRGCRECGRLQRRLATAAVS